MNTQISRRQFLKDSSMATIGFWAGCSNSSDFEIIIKNGKIHDGLGKKVINTDLGISREKIVAMGNLTGAGADFVIDASNLIVAPGFIDIHTHTDTELIVDPRGMSKISQGVTTEVSGNCGYSPFPLSKKDSLELRKRLKERYNIDLKWVDMVDFLNVLEKNKISMNYATFTGHGSLRGYCVGKNDVAPSPDQMAEMKKIIDKTMHEGSFGLSTGLEYAPGSYAKTEELIELSKIVAKNKGIYNTHMRNEDDRVLEAMDEAIRICREASVSLEIAHLKTCNEGNWHKVDEMIDKLEKANKSGLPVKADRYPYIAYGTGLSTFLPLWSRQGDTDDILARLKDNTMFADIKEYAESRGKRIGGWTRVMISYCHNKENKKWEGKNIHECAVESGMKETEFVRHLLIEERLNAGIVGFAMNEDNLCKVMASPYVMIGSDGNAVSPTGKLGTGKPHPRYYGTFPRVLGKYCREEKCIDLPAAVKKMTSMPAEKLGLKNRGIIKKGYYADITVFDPEKVSDNATFTNPHQTASGIEYVLVNGQVVVNKGIHTSSRPGKILRHQV
jgi:N-acyl-D-amino-acid deacylase